MRKRCLQFSVRIDVEFWLALGCVHRLTHKHTRTYLHQTLTFTQTLTYTHTYLHRPLLLQLPTHSWYMWKSVDGSFCGFSNTYVLKYRKISRRRRNMVDSAFESWRSIFSDPKKILAMIAIIKTQNLDPQSIFSGKMTIILLYKTICWQTTIWAQIRISAVLTASSQISAK